MGISGVRSLYCVVSFKLKLLLKRHIQVRLNIFCKIITVEDAPLKAFLAKVWLKPNFAEEP